MTPDEYMTVLLERQAAFVRDNPGTCPPLLEWFVRDSDADVFTPPAPEPERQQPIPRRFIPASELRAKRDALTAERDALDPGLPDRAAAGGVGLGKRRSTAQNARMDTALAKYTTLTTRIRNLDGRITRAEKREAK